MILKLLIVIIIIIILIFFCTLLFGSVLFIKNVQRRREIRRIKDIANLNPILKRIFSEETVKFSVNAEHKMDLLKEKLRDKYSYQTLEELLLGYLESETGETKLRAQAIAYHFGFPEKCLFMIRDRLTANIAIGCHKAGLYEYESAVPDMFKALDIVSGDIQLQALMAFARIGGTVAMIQALNKIHRFILVNERAFSEILNTFSGDRYVLFRSMIRHESEYLVHLFLKSIDEETAATLVNEIIAVYKSSSNREIRLAGIIAIGRSGNSRKIRILIDAMKDEEWQIRAMAAKTLGVLTNPRAIPLLKKAARDREWWVRQNAIASILAYPNCEEVLVSIVRKRDLFAYESILYTLGKANETKLLSTIREVWQEGTKVPEVEVKKQADLMEQVC